MLKTVIKVWHHRKLRYRYIYTVYSGDLAGGMFVYIKEEDKGDNQALLVLSPTDAIYTNKLEIEDWLRNGNIRYYQKMPKAYYKSCIEQFKYYAKKKGIYAGR